jgi:peroxidase
VALKLSKKNVKLEKPCIDIYSVNSAAHAGRFQLRLMDEMEKNLVANNVTVRPRSSSYTHLQFFQKTTESQELSRAALTAIETTRELTKRFHIYIHFTSQTSEFNQNLFFFNLF